MARILICSEWSALNTGYGVMTLEIAKRLHAMGHQVAELAMYAQEGDGRLGNVPWPVFPVVPSRDNKEAFQRYESDPHNQFGRMAFGPTLLKYRPDACVGWQDPWYHQHIATSPLRPFFKFLYIPTVDATPQKDEWLDIMSMADAIGAYTDWGHSVLEKEGGGSLKLVGAIPPGVDHKTYRPVQDKRQLRSVFGVPQDALVCGFVSRNQVRKRFPEMARAFRKFLDVAPAHIADRAILHWHTSWPDVGWDIPNLIRDSGVGTRIWLTYFCKREKCGHVFANRWAGVALTCPKCHEPTAGLPRTNSGVPREVLPYVYNLFDVYCQYANSEGFGLGLIEAASCGVPVMGVDYSAMSDIVRKLEGWPLRPLAHINEVETGCNRAVPDPDAFVESLLEVLSLPEPVRRARGACARDAVIRHYDWDRSVQKMSNVLVGMGPSLDWSMPFRPHQVPREMPGGLSNADFVRWGFAVMAGRPDLVNSSASLRMVRELDWGVSLTGSNPYFSDESFLGRSRSVKEVKRQTLIDIWMKMAEERNHWEQMRCRQA